MKMDRLMNVSWDLMNDIGGDRSASVVCDHIIKVLEPFNIHNKLLAQTYDGASVMSSELNGVQAKIRSYAPYALFTHCLAHRLNLVLQHSCSKIRDVNVFFSTLEGIPSFFHKSTKRTAVLNKIVGKRIPSHSDTRWSSNAKTLSVINSERIKLIDVFDKLLSSNDVSCKTIRQAEFYRNKLSEFDFAFFLNIFQDIFVKTELVFNFLQKKSIDIQMCAKYISSCETYIQNMRTEDTFRSYIAKTKETSGLSSPPPPRSRNDESNCTTFSHTKKYIMK